MIARVVLASTPQQRFLERIEAIRSRIDRLPDRAVQAAIEELDRLRRKVLVEMAAVQNFDAYRLKQLIARIEGVMEEFASRYQVAIAPFQREALALGRDIIGDPLLQSGQVYGVPQIPRRLVEATLDYQADLIQGLSASAKRNVTQAIRLGAIQGQSVFEVMNDVAGSLTKSGPFASIAARAEAITRTELSRLQGVTSQATLEESNRLVPDLQKQWNHTGGINPRPMHLLAHGQVRDVDDFFDVKPAANKPSEKALYPKDVRLSAANSVNCGCISLPFKADWPA